MKLLRKPALHKIKWATTVKSNHLVHTRYLSKPTNHAVMLQRLQSALVCLKNDEKRKAFFQLHRPGMTDELLREGVGVEASY
ncbi:hypothetical protein TNCV_2073781 [Trichonephila clavipes]|nr:hypothetical protein TNCV_2073781 [Trichonephila clavipes]